MFASGGGTVTLTNTTVASNEGSGGYDGTGSAVYAEPGTTVNVAHSTIVNNEGGIGGAALEFSSGTVLNSILSNNGTAACEPSSIGGAYNLEFGTSSCNNGSPGYLSANPQLGALGTYGGKTPLYPLIAGSPAIDAGDPAFVPPPDTDQRGTNSPRKTGAAVDIGAFEFRPIIVVNTTNDTQDAGPGDGVCADSGGLCSLRAAISEANTLTGPDEITLGAATYRLVLHGVEDGNLSGDLDVTDELTITGQGRASTIIEWDAADPSRERVLDLRASAGSVHLEGITVRNGYEMASGGGMLFDRVDLALTDVGVSNNMANDGGGLHGACSNLVITDSVIEGNGANLASGGGMLLGAEGCAGLAANISNTQIALNGARGDGGGLLILDVGLTLANSTIQGNSAGKGTGGGLCVGGQPVQISTERDPG